MRQSSRAWIVVAVLLAVIVTISVRIHQERQAIDIPRDNPQPGREVGQIIEGAGRANFDWFKHPGTKFGVAFRAQKDGIITRLTIPWRYTVINNDAKKSYGWGNFGCYTFELQSDGEGHLPSGDVIASAFNIRPLAVMRDAAQKHQDDYLLSIPLNADVTAGEMYHLVITNTDPDPNTNWSSINTLMSRVLPWEEWANSGTGARGEAFTEGRWKPWSSKYNPWNRDGQNACNGSHIPLLVTWADGSVSGDPYWSAAVEEPARIWGGYRAGEVFVWEQPSTKIAGIGLSVKKTGAPAGALLYHVEEVNKPEKRSGTMATADAIPPGDAQTWVQANLQTPFLLQKGHWYRLWFESPKSTTVSNCYEQSPVYVPGDARGQWAERSWGGKKGHLIIGTPTRWYDIETHDLTFSLKTAE